MLPSVWIHSARIVIVVVTASESWAIVAPSASIIAKVVSSASIIAKIVTPAGDALEVVLWWRINRRILPVVFC